MKIMKLYLKNFKHIDSGLGKREVLLDFSSSNKIINIFIGKMGSCKTVILGHLQPFHSFGTLDVRNQDGSIIEGEDGVKIIEYQSGVDYFIITHNYTWNRTTHNVKSYVEKNGNELNENGNQGSFRDVIEREFGIEQNFLRLLRLGPNVSNLIHMKSAERKSFVASLLRDAETYTMLHKKLMDDMRNSNSQTNILSNKLHHIGAENEEKMEEEYEINKNMILGFTRRHEEVKSTIYKLDASISSILKDDISYDDYGKLYRNNLDRVKEMKTVIDDNETKLLKYKEYPSINEVSKSIGALDNTIITSTQRISEYIINHEKLTKELSVLVDSKKIKGDETYVADLKETYNDLLILLEEYRRELEGFNLDYSSSYILSLLGDLNNMNIVIEEIAQYGHEIAKKLFVSNSSIVGWSKKQLEILHFQKLKVQREMTSIKHSSKYESPITLYLPPLCPTKECPYYRSHPYNIQKGLEKDNIEEETQLEILMNKSDEIDIKIYQLSDYPLLYSKMTNLKQMWNKVIPIVTKMGALNTRSLLMVLVNQQYRKWYDYDKIAEIIKLSEKREKYYELTENLNKVKNELASFDLLEDNTIDERIRKVEEDIDKYVKGIYTYEKKIKEAEKEIVEYNEIYIKLSQLSLLEKDIESDKHEMVILKNEIKTMESNLELIQDNVDSIKRYKIEDLELKENLQKRIEVNEKLKAIINDIKYTKKEFEEVLDYKETLKYIIDAVSSKEGIPLVLVKLFLNNAKDVVNELVSDVFGDVIEILDFDINETEFKIPYSINGVTVEDIEKASQGQQSIISIALSFALIRESLFDYNIMLLDEVDAPLYKHDRHKFISILFKQLQAINAEQVFLISHNNTFDGHPVNIIMTTEEIVDKSEMNSIMRVY